MKDYNTSGKFSNLLTYHVIGVMHTIKPIALINPQYFELKW